MYTVSERDTGSSIFVDLFFLGFRIASVSYSKNCKYECDVCYKELEERFNLSIPRPYINFPISW